MTAEQLKAAVREYAEEAFGDDWDAASVLITLGPAPRAETLMVLRGCDAPECFGEAGGDQPSD